MPHDCRMWRRVPSYCIWRPLHVAVREGLWGISPWGHSLACTEDYRTPVAPETSHLPGHDQPSRAHLLLPGMMLR